MLSGSSKTSESYNTVDIVEEHDVGSTTKGTMKSWQIVTKAIHFFEKGSYEEALPLLLKYESCEPRAMLLLSYLFSEGIGIHPDMKRAVGCLHRVVDHEHLRGREEKILAIALYYLGDLHFRGLVMDKDNSKAEEYWRRGATLGKDPATESHHHGSVKCQEALGMLFSDPRLKKLKKAVYWHKKAMASGSVVSEAALGTMYMRGVGMRADDRLVRKHLRNATRKGNVYAKGYLSAFYYQKRMYDLTVDLGFQLSSEHDYESLARSNDCPVGHVKQGISMGCFYLALCMQYGYGVEKNLCRAKSLIKRRFQLKI